MVFRAKKILVPVLVSAVAIQAVAAFIAVGGWHGIRVLLADGRWCATVSPNGSVERSYGATCD